MLGLLRRLFGRAGAAPAADPAPAKGTRDANDAVRAGLAARDDDGTAPRRVSHYAYPDPHGVADPAPFAQAAALAEGWGMEWRQAAAHGGIIMEQEAAIADAGFDDRTVAMSDALAAIGWDYDGWDCPAVPKPGETE